jgi:hypothetical protein
LLHDELDRWLDLYVQLVVLEGRRQGEVAVLGGIRVVRKRRQAFDIT